MSDTIAPGVCPGCNGKPAGGGEKWCQTCIFEANILAAETPGRQLAVIQELEQHIRAGERARMSRDAIIGALVKAFPKTHRPPDPADESCFAVFTAGDGYPAMRSLTYGEIADALAGLIGGAP